MQEVLAVPAPAERARDRGQMIGARSEPRAKERDLVHERRHGSHELADVEARDCCGNRPERPADSLHGIRLGIERLYLAGAAVGPDPENRFESPPLFGNRRLDKLKRPREPLRWQNPREER
jgi:hypothetical protein